MNCCPQCAISWSERVRESRHDWWAVPERGLKGTARPSTRPGNESSPVRHGLSLP
jgi:hypothetical protein